MKKREQNGVDGVRGQSSEKNWEKIQWKNYGNANM